MPSWVVWATTTGTRERVHANTMSIQTASRAANKLRSTSTSKKDGVDSFSTQQFFPFQAALPTKKM